ncbi:MAG: hypothetical protein IPH07_20370 [Deltaproteobacteria bacterium]|nr:hypothetical protein [Deltaproteobacteria bacterium]MBK8239950.1 hypothetical protein [Deltaproteobacteria bacterium]MBK8716065.1 hypothetical protein [Deltaproteobacteria bacterium]MBP7286862.1 hypothetical protein [Nannocystaceae bacterium]
MTLRASTSVDALAPSWVLRHSGGGIFGVGERGLWVGSGPDDDLRIADCPPRSARFHVAHGKLLLEAHVALSVSSRHAELVRLAGGAEHRLARGNVVHLGRAQIASGASVSASGLHEQAARSLPSKRSPTRDLASPRAVAEI